MQDEQRNLLPLVMFVDDDDTDLRVNTLILRKIAALQQVEVRCFSDGFVVLDFLQAQTQTLATRPCIMFLDLKMPGMSGLDVLEAMYQQDLKQFPVVVLSASGLPEDRRRAMQFGADDYGQKAFDLYDNVDLFEKMLTSYLPEAIGS